MIISYFGEIINEAIVLEHGGVDMRGQKTPVDTKPKSYERVEFAACKSTDIVEFTRRLHQVASKKAFLVQKLRYAGTVPIFLLVPGKLNYGPNLLIAAGFHGDEPAGCWGIIRFIETVPKSILNKSNLSFLPIVNPTGFRHNKHTNKWGENPNRGFCHTNSHSAKLSREGLVLMKHLATLKPLAKHGFLSLHEDSESTQFYIYTFENTKAPGPFSEALCAEEAKFFGSYADGMIEGGLVRNGIIFRQCDGSFEDFLFHEGIDKTACTETPGLLNINKRVEANVHVINKFVRFALTTYK